MHKAPLLPSLLVILRIAAASVLLFHPAFDQAHELDGWDVARFQEIADSDGHAYVDYEVEYPPGSLLAISMVSSLDDSPNRVVTTHRVIVALSLFVDLGLFLLMARTWGRRPATAYLLLGTPLVFFGLVRFDLWATGLAVVAAATIADPNSPTSPSRSTELENSPDNRDLAIKCDLATRSWFVDLAGSVAITAGVLVKVWPAVLILGALVLGRRRLAAMTAAWSVLGGAAWILVSGSRAPLQVLSLRGATGWHIESVAGSVIALLTDRTSALEANAYRIGTMNPAVIQLGRAAALAAMFALAWLGYRSGLHQRFALVILGSVAALIVSAPLFSPQFLLWLTPWAAMLCWSSKISNKIKLTQLRSYQSQALLLTGAAISLTALVQVVAGPANLDRTVPAVALLGRDVLLIVLVAVCGLALRRGGRPSAGTKDPLRSDRPSPWTTAPQSEINQVTQESETLAKTGL